VVLAVVGIHGVLSYEITRQTREIGIRLALGAQRSDVLWSVIDKGLAFAVIGIAIGSAGAAVLTQLLTSLLFGVAPRDAVIFALAAIGLLAISLVSSYLPARRASRVDPVLALRME
jgi:putative ABC transport system permease protein